MTWLAEWLSRRDTRPRPLPESPTRRRLRAQHEEFVAHERAIAENQRLRKQLDDETGHQQPGITPWWER